MWLCQLWGKYFPHHRILEIIISIASNDCMPKLCIPPEIIVLVFAEYSSPGSKKEI